MKCLFSLICMAIAIGQSFGQVSVSASVLLQGPYAGNLLMNTHLASISAFPLSQPYHEAPWNYEGQENIQAVPDSVVDWVLVELRLTHDTVRARRAALLLWNGKIVDLNMSHQVDFPYVPQGNYHVAILHRNHLPVMTATPHFFPNNLHFIFSDTTNTPLFGGGSQTQIQLEPGVFGMIAGDVNNDDQLKFSGAGNDRGPILQKILQVSGANNITAVIQGYHREDVTMDSIVKYSGPGNDPAMILQNIVKLTGSSSITKVFNGQVPIGTHYQSFQRCGDTLLDLRDGQKYPTVEIGTQCWMAKNLNIGTYVFSIDTGGVHSDMNNNGIIEKYCFENKISNCVHYGALYEWDEIMNYSDSPGGKGICPVDWHIPTDDEWKILEGTVDSLFGIGDTEWDKGGLRGYNAGGKLKLAGLTHWLYTNTGADNSYGFSALPGGMRSQFGVFWNDGVTAYFWSSSLYSSNFTSWFRLLHNTEKKVNRNTSYRNMGMSVRCIHDSVPCYPWPDQAEAGPNQLDVVADSVTLQANSPVIGTGTWAILSGSGGIIADSTNPTSLFYGLPGNSYTLIWSITTACGSNSDSVNISFADTSWHCGNILIDIRNGKHYPTVRIGNQCWMAKNLNIGIFKTSVYTGSSHSELSHNGNIEKYCYDNDTTNCNLYGGLYDWEEMMGYVMTEGIQGICMSGWHIPTDDEWKILEGTIDNQYGLGDTIWNNTGARGYNAGGKLKESGTGHWTSPNTGATNSTGFTALPGGGRLTSGIFINEGIFSAFWSSSVSATNFAWSRSLHYDDQRVTRSSRHFVGGISVRCLLDSMPPCFPQPTQSDAGTDQLNIQGNSVTLHANNPTNGNGKWDIISGYGGNFADSTDPYTVFSGEKGESYVLRWTITTQCGQSSDSVSISFLFACGDIFVDKRDGLHYPSVKIGSQCWMAKNLNAGTFIASTHIPGQNTHSEASNNGILEKYCYNNDMNHCDLYGGLYDWNEMMNYQTLTIPHKGICPEGWHLPDEGEWVALTNYLGGVHLAGGKMKKTGYLNWYSPNTGADNSSGFTGLPSGQRDDHGGFTDLRSNSYYWSATASGSAYALYRHLSYDNAYLYFMTEFNIVVNLGAKAAGYAVRCIRDHTLCSPQPDQASAGPDNFKVPGNSTTLQANDPVNGMGKWTICSGQGGHFADSSHHNTVFYGQPGGYYTLIWTIMTSCSSTSDSVTLYFNQSLVCGSTLTDSRDAKQYPTVQIGTQCWMAKNLNVGTFVPSTYTGSNHSNVSNNYTIEKYCYDNSTSNCNTFGGLYDWNEMMAYLSSQGTTGICPSGWHIPTNTEYTTLINYLGGADLAGGKMKQTGTTYWDSPNTGATNSSGFTGIAGGARSPLGPFAGLGQGGAWWTSTTISGNAWLVNLMNDNDDVDRYSANKVSGFSVRCMQNCTPSPSMAYITPDSISIPDSCRIVSLLANTPIIGTGKWSILSGTGFINSFSNIYDPLATFVCIEGYDYILAWTITTPCGSTSDIIKIHVIGYPFKKK